MKKTCYSCAKSSEDRILGDIYMCEWGEKTAFFNSIPGIDFECPNWEGKDEVR